MRRPYLGLLIAVAVYVGLRALVLHTAFDQVAMSMYEQYPMGTIPRLVMLEGPGIPLRHFYDNAAGQILTALLALPFYLLLGPTYLALKLVPFLLGLGVLLLAWSLLRRHFGELEAALGALLIALGPGTMLFYSLAASGNHFENLFFTLLALWAFARLETGGGRRVARLWLAGYTAGLAVFVFLGAITPVGLMALAHLGRAGARRAARDLVHAGPAFVLGLLPLIALNLGTRARGGQFLAAKFAAGAADPDAGRLLDRFVEFFTLHLLPAPTFPDWLGIPGRVADAAFVAAFAAAWLAALPEASRAGWRLARGAILGGAPEIGARQSVLVVLVLYLPLTALAYALSNLRIGGYSPPIVAGGYRYYLPTFLFACLLLAAAAGRGRAVPRLRWLGSVAASLALAACAFDLALVDLSFARAGVGPRYEGHYFRQLARTLLGRMQSLSEEQVRAHAEGLPPEFRARVYEGLGFYRAMRTSAGGAAEPADAPRAFAAGFPAEREIDVLRGVGICLREDLLSEPRRAAAEARLRAWSAAQPEETGHVLEGLGTGWGFLLASRTEEHFAETRRLIAALSDLDRQALSRGHGLSCGRVLRRGIAFEQPWVAGELERLPANERAAWLFGVGLGLADGAETPAVPPGAAELVGPDQASPLLDGLAARLREIHDPDGARAWMRTLEPELPAPWREEWRLRAGH